MAGRTFGVDLLADTLHSLVLDRSVTTIDVEQGVLEEHGAAGEEDGGGDDGSGSLGGTAAGKAARREASGREAAAAGRLAELPGVLLEWAAVRHVVRW